jgi:hypothetical protein
MRTLVLFVILLALGGASVAAASAESRASPSGPSVASAVSRWSAAHGSLPLVTHAEDALAGGSTTWTDPTGDSGAVPDVTTVTVSNDDTPVVTIAVSTPNRPTLANGDAVFVLLDTDRSSSTGYMGFEKALLIGQVSGTQQATQCQWSPSVDPATCAPLTASHSGGVATFTVHPADVGITTGFAFLVVTVNAYNDDIDYAPDGPPGWTYVIQTGAPPPPAPPPPAPTAGETLYTDPAGDSVGAPDITSVTISNDPSGLITVRLGVTGIEPADTDLYVYFDTDRDSDTGSVSGCEYLIAVETDSTGHHWVMGRWDGDAWAQMPQSPTMGFDHTGDVVTFTLGRKDIGNAKAFDFWTASGRYLDGEMTGEDLAPDTGRWHYTVSVVSLVAGKLVARPTGPVSGKRFAVAMRVTRADTGAAPTGAKLSFRVTLGGKTLKATGAVAAGTARVTMIVPRASKGKQLRVAMTVTALGVSVTRAAVYRVG